MTTTEKVIKDIEESLSATPPAEDKEVNEFVGGILKANSLQLISYIFSIATVVRMVYHVVVSGKYKDIDKKSIKAEVDGVTVDMFPVIKFN
jgi:hypothetical protein